MKIVVKYIVLVFLVFGIGNVFSQSKFYAKGNSVAYTGQTYSISFVLENVNGKNLRLPKTYPGFEIIGGPSQSSNYSWVNGKSTSSKSFTYYLQAKKEGVFYIPSASVEVGNRSIMTKKLKVTVKKGEARQQRQSRRNGGQNTQAQTTTDNGDWKKQVSDNLFVKMYADKSNPYVGEQVTVSIKLYQRIQTFQTQVTEMPEFKGFWIKDFELKTGKWEKEEYNGVWYNTMVLNKYALFPQRAGEFSLKPMKLETIVQVKSQGRSRSIWDQFFGRYENKQFSFQSNRLKIKVKSLPLNAPDNFSGAVGNFKYTAKIDSSHTKTGSTINLKTKIVGTGNIMMIDAPKFSFPKDFEIYDPEEKEYISKKSTYIYGSKKYDYMIIPKKPGEYKIEPIPFCYFDLGTKKYKTIYSDTLNISVEPSADYIEELDEINENSEELVLDTDIKPIHLAFDFDKKEGKMINSSKFWFLWGSPTLLFFLLLIGKNKLENYNPDLVAINKRRANKLALKKLKLASEYLKENDTKLFYNEIVRALWDYVAMKLDIKVEDLSKDNIEEKLTKQNVSKKTTDIYIDLIEKSEMAVFSPIGETEMQKDFDIAKEIIINVESEIS